MDKIERKTTSIKINPEIWGKFKIRCIERKKQISEYLEEILKNEINTK